MSSRPAPKLGHIAAPAGIKAVVAPLDEFVSQLAELILSLETERGECPDDAVLRYVADAVTTEIQHRRRTIELTRTLAGLERETAVSAAPASIIANGPEEKPAAPARAPVKAFVRGSTGGTEAEEAFYRALVAERVPVHLRCLDGYEIASAIVRDVGAYALLVDTSDGPQLFLKRNVISIVRS
jgi:hypothetical protein